MTDETIGDTSRADITRIHDDIYLPQRDELNRQLADAYERHQLRWEERILQTLDPAYENRIRRLHEQRKALQERIIHDVVRLLPEEALRDRNVPKNIKDKPRL